MSPNSYKWISCCILLFVVSANIIGQIVQVTTTNTCSNLIAGSILIEFNQSLVDDYAFPYQAEWENITNGEFGTFTLTSLSYTIDGLTSGDYELIINLDDHCEIDLEATIASIPAPELLVSSVCICPGGYGALNVIATGGSGEYSYAWSGPGPFNNPNISNPIVTGVGTYNVTVADNQTGCETTAQTTVIACTINLADLVTVTPDCNEEGTSTLSIQLPPGYGLAPFEFKWVKLDFGLVETDVPADGFASLENAVPGEYCLHLKTLNCSEQVCNIIVTEQPKPGIEYTVSPVTSSGSDGEISLDVSGQPGPFSYSWSNGGTASIIGGLSTGNYCVTVTDDGSGCTSTSCIKLVSCNYLDQALNTLEADVTAISYGAGGTQALGAIDITNLEDIFPGYDFNFHWAINGQWNNNIPNTEDIHNLPSGVYDVSVTSDICSNFQVLGEWEICGFELKFGQFDATCSTASIKVMPTGAGTYTYSWEGVPPPPIGQNPQILPNAAINIPHCVTVTSWAYVNGVWVSGCKAYACYTPKFKPLGVELISSQAATFGSPSGSLVVNATGGTPNSTMPFFDYDWSNGMTGASITGLSPGYYTVTVTDACENTVSATYYIQCEFGNSEIEASIVNSSCGITANGSITLTKLPNLAHPAFSFKWSNGETTQDISHLVAGEYCVKITELTTGCYAVKCFTVGNSGTPSFTVAFEQHPGCYPLNEGTLTAILIPVNPANPPPGPFNYAWGTWFWGPQTSFPNSETLTHVAAGWYGVVVTDALGCTASNTTLLWPPMPTFAITPNVNPIMVCKGANATEVVNISGAPQGPGAVTYSWLNGAQNTPTNTGTSNTLGGLIPGNWGVTATDGHGCQAYTNFSVQTAIVNVAGDVIPNCNNGSSITLTPSGYGTFTYIWKFTSETGGQQITIGTAQNLTQLTSAGTYCVTVTNDAGCTSTKCFTVKSKEAAKLYLGSQIVDDNCDGDCIGKINLDVKPFSPPPTYQWNDDNNITTKNRINLCNGTYTVTITSNQCVETHEFDIHKNGLIDCGIKFEGPSPDHDGSYRYRLPFLTVWAVERCGYDGNCGLFDNDCTEIWIDPLDISIEENYCWTGIITIEYDDGIPNNANPTTELEVYIDQTGFYKIKWTSNDNKRWRPPSSGTYNVYVNYEGNGLNTGDNCSVTVPVEFYGNGNYNDAIGFNNDYWFNINAMVGSGFPTNLNDAYFGAWKCGTCDENGKYIMENDQNKCKSTTDWEFTFFNYKPNDFSNPCKGGGELTIMDFNANGDAEIIDNFNLSPADANAATLFRKDGLQPFNINLDTWCPQSGWCWFDQDYIYPNGNLDQPILATWGGGCKPVTPPLPPGTPVVKCTSEGGTNPCPDGLICINGNCSVPCVNGECVNGNCVTVNGINVCVETDECNPPCQPGYECHEGHCYLDENFCGFNVTENGGGEISVFTFLEDDMTLNDPFTLNYKTYYIEDNITVSGNGVLVPQSTGCVHTDDPNGQPLQLDFKKGSGDEIIVTVESCGGPNSKFYFNITCGEVLQNGNPSEKIFEGPSGGSHNVLIHPNPFSSEIKVILPDVESSFNGEVILLDNLGRVVSKKEASFNVGFNSLNIDGLEAMVNSLYIVLVKKDGEVYASEKAIKLK